MREPAIEGSLAVAAFARLRGTDRFIPLTPFALAWRQTELGEDLRRYAPRLVDAVQSEPSC